MSRRATRQPQGLSTKELEALDRGRDVWRRERIQRAIRYLSEEQILAWCNCCTRN